MGLLIADLRADFAVTRLMALSAAKVTEIEAIICELRQHCEIWFEERRWGLAIARKSGMPADRVINTLDRDSLARWLHGHKTASIASPGRPPGTVIPQAA